MAAKPFILIDTGIIGGPGRGIIQLLQGFELRSIDYLLGVFSYPNPKSREFEQAVQERKFRFTQIFQRNVLDPRPIVQCIRLARQHECTLIQSHGYKSHFVAGIAARWLQLPWVAFAHGWTAEDRKVRFYHWLDTKMLRYADLVVAVSPPLLSTFRTIRGVSKKTELVLNAIDKEALPGREGGLQIRLRHGIPKEAMLIGCVGRLSYEKGQDILLRAAAGLLKHSLDFRIVFLGDGPEREALSGLARELNLSRYVIFIPHEYAVRDYYEAFDLLVLPSRSEGLPNVVLEAMGLSVPVVAMDVGAVGEIITDGKNGWIVPAGNINRLTEILLSVLSEREKLKEIGKAGSRSLTPKFCPSARVDKILALYDEVLDGTMRYSQKAVDESAS